MKTLIKNRHQYGLLGFHLFCELSGGVMQHIKYQDNIFITLINQSTLSPPPYLHQVLEAQVGQTF